MGSRTTPLPMTQVLPVWRMPEGILMEHEFLAVGHDRVTGVAAALVAGDDIDLFGQDVHHFRLALVAPLGADDDDVLFRTLSFRDGIDVYPGHSCPLKFSA